MAGQQWEVVGGADKGGIMVRAGRDLSTAQLPEKLSTGATVEELARAGDRLNYKLLTGTGPSEGWVSIRLRDKVLLEARTAPPEGRAEASPRKPAPEPSRASPSRPPKSEPPASPPWEFGAGHAFPNVLEGDFPTRLEALKEKYPGAVDLELPGDAGSWAPKDLENFFESGGSIRPQGYVPARPASPKKKPAEKGPAPELPQFGTSEALKLQEQLRDGFKEKDFQKRLSKLYGKYPQRKVRGHADGPRFFEAFEMLATTVYAKVLPRYDLSGDWDGVQVMNAKMVTALMHPKVKKQHEEINTLLGLPRDAVLKPSKKTEEVFIYRPERDGAVPGYPLPLAEDDEGDEAHSFLVEDLATGELQCHVENADCWYRVVYKPHVAVRARPDPQADSIGRKSFGDRVHVQRVVDGKWLLLHEAELKKLNAEEGWVLGDGAELGLNKLLERA